LLLGRVIVCGLLRVVLLEPPRTRRPELALRAVRAEDGYLFGLELVVGQERPPAALEADGHRRALVALESRDHAQIIAHASEGSTDLRCRLNRPSGGQRKGGEAVLAARRMGHALLETIGQIRTFPVSNSYGFAPPNGFRKTFVVPSSALSIAVALVIGWKFDE
jgi:hypothetical protein